MTRLPDTGRVTRRSEAPPCRADPDQYGRAVYGSAAVESVGLDRRQESGPLCAANEDDPVGMPFGIADADGVIGGPSDFDTATVGTAVP